MYPPCPSSSSSSPCPPQDQYGETALDYADDGPTKAAFLCALDQEEREGGEGGERGGGAVSRLHVAQVTLIFSYLPAQALCRAACVCGLWHGAAAHSSLWARLGLRRWELSLRTLLGSGLMQPGAGGGSAGSSRQGSRKNSKILAVLESRALQQEEQLR